MEVIISDKNLRVESMESVITIQQETEITCKIDKLKSLAKPQKPKSKIEILCFESNDIAELQALAEEIGERKRRERELLREEIEETQRHCQRRVRIKRMWSNRKHPNPSEKSINPLPSKF